MDEDRLDNLETLKKVRGNTGGPTVERASWKVKRLI